MIFRIERMFGLQGLADGSLIRTGLGLAPAAPPEEEEEMQVHVTAQSPTDAAPEPLSPNGQYVIPLDPNDPERNERVARAFAIQASLHQNLRSAGFI